MTHSLKRHLNSMRAVLWVIALSVALWPTQSIAEQTELLMFEQPLCEWCEAWDEEIGGIYPLTEEGKFAPLRRVQMHDAPPQDLKDVRWPRFSPTFVLMVDGEEIGRIRGYPGEDFFWGLLGELMKKAKTQTKSG